MLKKLTNLLATLILKITNYIFVAIVGFQEARQLLQQSLEKIIKMKNSYGIIASIIPIY